MSYLLNREKQCSVYCDTGAKAAYLCKTCYAKAVSKSLIKLLICIRGAQTYSRVWKVEELMRCFISPVLCTLYFTGFLDVDWQNRVLLWKLCIKEPSFHSPVHSNAFRKYVYLSIIIIIFLTKLWESSYVFIFCDPNVVFLYRCLDKHQVFIRTLIFLCEGS